jgi:hypothetical protein
VLPEGFGQSPAAAKHHTRGLAHSREWDWLEYKPASEAERREMQTWARAMTDPPHAMHARVAMHAAQQVGASAAAKRTDTFRGVLVQTDAVGIECGAAADGGGEPA